MGHKAQLPSGEAVCCCCALCILSYIPVVASVCGHSCSSAELLYKVFQGCCCVVFFFSFWIFPPSCCVKGPYGTAITSGPAGNSHSGSTPEQGCTSKKKMKEGGGQNYFQEQNLRIFRACITRQATPPPPTPMSPVIICHSLLSLYGVRCWCGHLPSVPHQSQLGRRITACWVLRATALAREQLGSLLWL